MKNRLFVILAVALLAILLTPALATAQATDNATLTVTGTVPSIVKIGFGSIGSDGTLTFADLTNTYGSPDTDISLLFAANVGFDISVQSANSGALINSSAGSFKNDVSYTLDVGGTSGVDLSTGNDVTVLTGQSAGAGNITVTVTPENLDFAGFNESSTIGDVNAQGDYTDTLTFTITSTS